ncbi:unnamed protein product [Prorocentrum cordatum]|uniref:Uncharacterized protein n=1 Tax=Prorocentrum cordatum TaxID=2364126 RepID=A0ABN9WAW0_9DINO|nr:unnamed protein product [Polarella glacialis]
MGKRAVWPPNGKVKVETLSQSLHADGWLELGELPEWEVFDVAEKYHAEYHDRITRLLERERPRWFEDVDEHRNVRPGQVVARELSRRFEPKGLHISAVHPSVSDDESLDYPATGPRFYVSVIPAAMRRGPAPPPPDDVVCLLWPDPQDRCKPWITELGWVMTPQNPMHRRCTQTSRLVLTRSRIPGETAWVAFTTSFGSLTAPQTVRHRL